MSRAQMQQALNADEEIASLIAVLHATERRLAELTGGEVDAVADREGRPFLLRQAQERMRSSEAAKQAAMLDRLRESEAQLRRLNAELERRVSERTAELLAANKELEAFDYSVSHDLRAPLNRIEGFSAMLGKQYGDKLDANGRDLVQRIARAGRSMDQLVGDLFALSTVTRGDLVRSEVDVSALAESIIATLRRADPVRDVVFEAPAGVVARADPGLLRVALENLLENAWKFTRGKAPARVAAGCLERQGEHIYFVRDNGCGFDMDRADKLFTPFMRLHSGSDVEGTGIGLATVQRIVRRHGGRVWAEAFVDRGATFFFTLSA